MKKFLLLILFVFPALISQAQFYNGSNQEFGKSRVQYNQFLWQSFSYERFKIYFYAGGKNHSIYVAKAAHQYLAEIEKSLDYFLDEKLEFVIYNSQSHFKQSNIGLVGDNQNNIGGVTRIVGNKVFLYYEGDHEKLDRQIKSGISNAILNHMMYGGSWKDVLKNSTLLTLPKWFVEGYVSYMGSKWNIDIENKVKSGVNTKKYKHITRLEGEDAVVAGHAIWNYVAEVYGEGVIPNVLYMARISRNVESGFLFVLGISLKKLNEDFIKYYGNRFLEDDRGRQEIGGEKLTIKTRATRNYSQFKLSPDGMYASYVSNESGQYRVWIYDIAENKSKQIFKAEQKLDRVNDQSFPVVGWHPMGGALTFFIEHKGELKMYVYTLDEEKLDKRNVPKMDKVISFDYSDDGKNIIFSGVADGKTDLFYFRMMSNTMEQLTNDIFDDLQPKFVHNSTAIIFSSNRKSDTIALKEPEIKPYGYYTDIFICELKGKTKLLKRITNTPFENETWPSQYDSTRYTFLGDANGLRNRYVSFYDSTIDYIDTAVHYRYFSRTEPMSNYKTNVLEYDVNEKKGKTTILVLENGEYGFHILKRKDDKIFPVGELKDTKYKQLEKQLAALKDGTSGLSKPDKVDVIDNSNKDSNAVDIDNYIFKDDKPTYEKVEVVIKEKKDVKDTLVKKNEDFELPNQYIYKINFISDQIVSQIDNNYLTPMYQRFSGSAGYFQPGINGLFKIGLTDVFEDYRIIGGFRYSGDFSNNEYLLVFDDLSKQLDKRYTFYRQSFNSYSRDYDITKTHSHEVRGQWKYPFTETLYLRGTLGYRNDRVVTLATDYQNLDKPNVYHHIATPKLELVFDNTRFKGLNLYNGTRAKVFVEYIHDFSVDNPGMYVVGLDVRHYHKIHRDIIYAGRIASSYSFGNQKLLYYLGGVDNWILPNFDNSMQIATDQNYAFQSLATPLRGFFQNARNGCNFAVINNEIRFPVFKYFAQKPLKSDFAENFQFVTFLDIGSAWTGATPYSNDNSFNTIVYATPGNPIVVTIENQRDPIVYGYGWGVRSRIFGYWIRFDWAIGVDDGQRMESVRYVSLSLDF